jgi:sugar lactone lactonase YvrE
MKALPLILKSPFFVALGLVFFNIAVAAPVVDSVAYQPLPALELKGALLPNKKLVDAELLALRKINGPEDIDVDANGYVYGAAEDGKIIRVNAIDNTVELFAETGGRPLGLHFDSQGNLIVCDAFKGLLSISPKGEITTLLTEVAGQALVFTDDLDIASDGTIYFSDASTKFDQHNYMLDLIEARPHGRLIAYYPGTKNAEVLLEELYFANGVALSQNEDFVLVNETYRYRITRYWLKGEKAGSSDIFIDNLPGFPDGVSANRNGSFWVALYTVRNPLMDAFHPYPSIKNFMAKMPRSLWPKPEPYGFVLKLNEQGEIVESLQDPTGEHLYAVTSVQEHKGKLYFGSLHNDRIGVLRLNP